MLWQELYSSLSHLTPVASPPEKPTDAALDEFEKKWRFHLPKEYREFVKLFGPGELGNKYKIRAAGCAVPSDAPNATVFNMQTDLECFNTILRTPDEQLDEAFVKERYADDAERITRLVCFADNQNFELIGWDPEDMRDSALNEYGIYIVLRDEDQCMLLAESFMTFIEEVCFGIRYLKLFDESISDATLAPPKTFRPAALWGGDKRRM